jgi:hypothetical protein
VEARTLAHTAVGIGVALLLARVPAHAEPLDQLIPNLFGGTLSTSITPFVNVPGQSPDVQSPRVADRFRNLSAALATARSLGPIPSASGAFRFEWDPELDTFVRRRQSLGPIFAERAQTLGDRTVTVSVSYSHIRFSSLEGDSLNHVRSSQPVFTDEYLAQLPESDRVRAQDNALVTELDLDFALNQLFFSAAYGLTDRIDLSLAIAVNHADMNGRASAVITDENGDRGAFFVLGQPGAEECSTTSLCAIDSFNEDAFGTGDIYLRAKWHAYDTRFADLALVGVVTLPTGHADDFLGFHDPTFTPWLIASKQFGRFAPHLNLGYAFRSGKDVSQAQWIAGGDAMAFPWLTVGADFLGFHDDKRDGINDDIIQSALSLKLNPFGQTVIGAGFQFPVNRSGLRADVIYTVQIETTF